MAGLGKEYIIGRGQLLFNLMIANSKTLTGELYFGNTPELSSSMDMETLDHYDADEGLNVKDESVTLENNLTLAFTTDNISIENLGLWYGGPTQQETTAAAVGLTYTVPAAKKGRYYQIGQTDANPLGERSLDNVVINYKPDPANPAVVLPAANYEMDIATGRIYIELDAPDIEDGETDIEFTYDLEASTRTVIIGRGDEIRGALRFNSKNPVGKQRNYYWPYVKLTPSGDYALKGSEWQQMSFSVEVLKKNSATERVYIEAVEV